MTNSAKIKGLTSNSIGYTGIVTLSRYIGSKKVTIARVKNEGNIPLFDFLADCLAGNFDTAKIDRPTKIMLLNTDADGTLTRAGNFSFIHITSKPERVYSDEGDSRVCYSFSIPPEALIGTNCNMIGLYTASATEADLNNFAARCAIDIDTNAISLSMMFEVDWELRISNK